MRFRVTTPNPQYQGKAAGVLFNEGQAIVDSDLPNSTGKPTEHVVIDLQEFGYKIEPLDEEARFFLEGDKKEEPTEEAENFEDETLKPALKPKTSKPKKV